MQVTDRVLRGDRPYDKIEHHNYYDHDIVDCETTEDYVELRLDEPVQFVTLAKKDVRALARHYGLIKEAYDEGFSNGNEMHRGEDI